MNKYKEWCIRQGSQAQCSPGLIVLGIVAVVAAVCYVYRNLIINTLIDLGIVLGCLLGAIAICMALAHGISYQRRVRAEQPLLVTDPSAQPSEAEVDAVLGNAAPSTLGTYEDEFPRVRESAVDRPVPAGLDREIDADLANLLS